MHEMLRERIEVIIVKKGQVLIQEHRTESEMYLCFVGGGVDNIAPEEAAYKEALEEAGIAIKNVRMLNYSYKSDKVIPGNPKNAWRERRYTGSLTRFCVADFDYNDHCVFGKQGDGFRYFFVSPESALSMFSIRDTYSEARFNALKEYIASFAV